MTATVKTREQAIERAGSEEALVDFESRVLELGPEALPSCAVDVLAGRGAGRAYWRFIGQMLLEEDQ